MLQIRQATTADASYIALIGRIAFGDTFSPIFDSQDNLQDYLNRTYQVEKIRESIEESSENRYWIAFFEGLPVGFMKVKLENEQIWQLQKIYILRDFLDKKNGYHFLQLLDNEAIKSKVKNIWLTVEVRNERAIRFYEKIGFYKKEKTIFTIGTQTFDFELMEKNF